ncbi:MAG TPA: hypothetical protein VGQ35_12180 [Dongiaceae bacterium]|jgi:predicted RNase H-like HicB family nuclease|nr:hypothetical protein [Dongiaceae bacterium]
MTHYIAIFVAAESGGWRALFPDVPDCEAEAYGLARAKDAAATSLVQHAKASGGVLPSPRTLEEIERDGPWLSQNGIDLSKAIVTIVPWPDGPFGDPQ